jgi:hypothetical protein
MNKPPADAQGNAAAALVSSRIFDSGVPLHEGNPALQWCSLRSGHAARIVHRAAAAKAARGE